MLDIGWMEMAVIVIIALLVVGPRELPRVIRSINEWLGKARSMAREFKSGLDHEANSMIDEAASTHDFTADSDDDDGDYWNTMSGSWRYVEPGDGAKKNPKRHKKARTMRLKHRRGAEGGRPKVRT
jgi:Tat protein translocase TatB subunit